MALVPCCVRDCPWKVREGLQRPWFAKGTRGQPLADGVMCWRHRAKLTEKRVREAGNR